MTRKEDQLRDAFVAIGIPGNLAHQALKQFPTAEANQHDVDILMVGVGYPAGYGTVKDVQAQPLAAETEAHEPKSKKKNEKGK